MVFILNIDDSPVIAESYNSLTLAFLGDAVYELEIRRFLCRNGSVPSKILHKNKVTYVCASYQAKAYDLIEPILSSEELSVMKRGRNTNGASVPKSSSPIEYRKATGLESLLGYLYLKNKEDRINEICTYILENN